MTCIQSKQDGRFTVCLNKDRYPNLRVSPGTCARCQGIDPPKPERSNKTGCVSCKEKMLKEMKGEG